MVVISIINLQKQNFQEIKTLFESLFLTTKIIHKDRNWINYFDEGRIIQDLTCIMFDIEWQSLIKAIKILQKNRAQLIKKNQGQQVEIGVNTDNIMLLNVKNEDKELVLNGVKDYKILPLKKSQGLYLKFESTLEQAKALETMLNFIQIEDYSIQNIFIIDLDQPINDTELNESLSRIQSKVDQASIKQQNGQQMKGYNHKINGKRKASDKQTEEISHQYEQKNEKEDEEASLFNFHEFLQVLLFGILLGFVSAKIKGRALFF